MKDRVPKFPGRIKLIPVPGQEGVYDLVRADEPVEVGTALNKAALLSDATAALYGLSSSATVNSVLDKLSGGVLVSGRELFIKHNPANLGVSGCRVKQITCFNGFFYAVAMITSPNYVSYVIRSNNGVDWDILLTRSNEEFYGGIASDKYFSFLSRATVSPHNVFLYRINTKGNYAAVGTPFSRDANMACNGYGYIVAVFGGTTTSSIYYSTNYGGSWITKAVNIPLANATDIVYGNGMYVISDNNGSNIIYSASPGGTWTKASLPSGAKPGPRLSFANNKFYLSGTAQTSYYSSNAVNWYPVTVNTAYGTKSMYSKVIYDAESAQYFAIAGYRYVLKSTDGITFMDAFDSGNGNTSLQTLATQKGLTVILRASIIGDPWDAAQVAEYVSLKDMAGKYVHVWDGIIPDAQSATFTIYAVNQRTQQDITDLQLSDIEQGQALTDLELMIMEGQANV